MRLPLPSESFRTDLHPRRSEKTMKRSIPARTASLLALICFAVFSGAQTSQTIYTTNLGQPDEITTNELIQALGNPNTVVFDARPPLEYATSHIPGALNVAQKPGVPFSEYVSDVAEINRILNGDHSKALIVYCNGPFCGKSKRLSTELRAAGWNVRRYQLGIPTWRALVGLTQIEVSAMSLVYKQDKTAVWIDVREPADFTRKSIRGAVNIPRSLVTTVKDTGELKKAKDDGRLPMNDHNTRVIVFAENPADARYVAAAIANEAFHNVMFFHGSFQEARDAVRGVKKTEDESND
jgi:rhodanese-related sulfurtransferase